MKNFVTATFVMISLYYFVSITCTGALGATTSSLNVLDTPNRNRARIVFSRFHARANQYRRLRPEILLSDFGDDDDLFDLTKRQQTNSDDYGHLRFGKRDEQFDDYGHMRFGRNNVD